MVDSVWISQASQDVIKIAEESGSESSVEIDRSRVFEEFIVVSQIPVDECGFKSLAGLAVSGG